MVPLAFFLVLEIHAFYPWNGPRIQMAQIWIKIDFLLIISSLQLIMLVEGIYQPTKVSILLCAIL